MLKRPMQQHHHSIGSTGFIQPAECSELQPALTLVHTTISTYRSMKYY